MDSPLKWHGGKHYLAQKLWELCKDVPHVHRVEVFGGSLAFTLATEPEGYSEVVNDKHDDLMTFWGVLGDPEIFPEFQRLCECTPFSETSWEHSEYLVKDEARNPKPRANWSRVERAWAMFVFVRQSMAGRMTSFAPLSKRRTRRGMNEQASAWLTCVEGLPQVHERLKRVAVRNQEFAKLIPSEDTESTLFYCDPPYMHETRSTTTEYGQHEMSESDHRCLLNRLAVIRGKFLLSGYRSDLYDEASDRHGWCRVEFDMPNNSASGSAKERRTEVVWKNF